MCLEQHSKHIARVHNALVVLVVVVRENRISFKRLTSQTHAHNSQTQTHTLKTRLLRPIQQHQHQRQHDVRIVYDRGTNRAATQRRESAPPSCAQTGAAVTAAAYKLQCGHYFNNRMEWPNHTIFMFFVANNITKEPHAPCAVPRCTECS